MVTVGKPAMRGTSLRRRPNIVQNAERKPVNLPGTGNRTRGVDAGVLQSNWQYRATDANPERGKLANGGKRKRIPGSAIVARCRHQTWEVSTLRKEEADGT